MNKNSKNYKDVLSKLPKSLTDTENGGGVDKAENQDSILKDEPSIGAFQEKESDQGEQKEADTTQGAEEKPKQDIYNPMGVDTTQAFYALPTPQKAVPALNLEQTLRVVKSLHQATIQRDNLLSRIEDLEKFEVNLKEESDELEKNIYAGCKLIIADGNGQQFVTNTSKLIAKVAEFVKQTCNERLTEIEAEIVFPY